MSDEITAQLVGLEHARCIAVSNSDAAAVELLISDRDAKILTIGEGTDETNRW